MPPLITSFPVTLSETPTDIKYDSRYEPLSVDIQWKTRVNPPAYVDIKTANSPKIDEVGFGKSDLTTLAYQNVKYTLLEVQLCRATHQSWVIPATQKENNVADMILTFSTPRTDVPYRYIVVVQPILSSETGLSPTYLQGLAGASQGAFSLQSLFPEVNQRFAYYVTSLTPEAGRSQTESCNVFIGVTGLSVSARLLADIQRVNGMGTTGWPSFAGLPFQARLSQEVSSVDINKVLTTTVLFDRARALRSFKNSELVTRDDTLDSYKCVPFDPDNNIVMNSDGQPIIRVNADTGQVLSSVVDARAATRAAEGTVGKMDPGRLRDYMATALGIVLSIIVFGSIIYLAIVTFRGSGGAAAGQLPVAGAAGAAAGAAAGLPIAAPVAVAAAPSVWSSLPLWLLILLVGGFLGFIIGAMLS